MNSRTSDIGTLAVTATIPSPKEILLASRPAGEGMREVELSAPTIHCGACIHTIEHALRGLADVIEARVNLTTRRVLVRWRGEGDPPPFAQTMANLGYMPHLGGQDDQVPDETREELIRALAVAGFSAGNIMALSVSVWSGADGAAQSAFHWLSAIFGLPALIYSGRVFYRSAWKALRQGRTNMDVPISIGVLLAFGMSIYDTLNHTAYAYFDASVTLLFFLLVGRTLDYLMRERARNAVNGLARLVARGAMVERDGGLPTFVPVDEIRPGMTVLLAAGERAPVDATVLAGQSELDCSLVTGESTPRTVARGARIEAGTLNLSNPLRLEANASTKDSFLAEMVRLMQAAESGHANYRRIADRAAALYAPAVHIIAFLSFMGWLVLAGGVHQALTIAVAVLIITCPCALGLAVPIVQVIAARLLFEHGILVKDGGGLERLVEIDTVVFDKTGTLTLGYPELRDAGAVPPQELALAAALAAHSRHPYCRALIAAAAHRADAVESIYPVVEIPGRGLEAHRGSDLLRLGRPDWALEGGEAWGAEAAEGAHTVLTCNGTLLAAFRFDDRVRQDAGKCVAELKRMGLSVELLSGDHTSSVAELARLLGIERFTGGVSPQDKVARLAELTAQGHKVLMVGDGLNDAPALASAYVSIAPSNAADVGRNVADFVFLRESLNAVAFVFSVSRRVAKLVRQNFVLAVGYNIIALPFAIAGYVTPLIAALAMSSSSILVVGNAMRLVHAVPKDSDTRDRSRKHWRARFRDLQVVK